MAIEILADGTVKAQKNNFAAVQENARLQAQIDKQAVDLQSVMRELSRRRSRPGALYGTTATFVASYSGGNTRPGAGSPASGTGTVTSVDCTVPDYMKVMGVPITDAGTIDLSFRSQLANLVFRSGNSGGAPEFTALTASDLASGGGTGAKLLRDDMSWQESDSISYRVTQSSHGFSVGNAIRHNGTSYVKAQADTPANAEVIGLVSQVVDTNTFSVTLAGRVTGLSGLSAGEAYFLSDTTAGALTATAPDDEDEIEKPILIAISSTSGVLVNFRGKVVPAEA